jgi:hypothetical protein
MYICIYVYIQMTPLHDALTKLASMPTALRRRSQPLLDALVITKEGDTKGSELNDSSAENHSSSTVRNSFNDGLISPSRNSFAQDALESNTDDEALLYFSPILPTAVPSAVYIYVLEIYIHIYIYVCMYIHILQSIYVYVYIYIYFEVYICICIVTNNK